MAGGQKNGYEPTKMQLSRPVLRVKKARVRTLDKSRVHDEVLCRGSLRKFDANRTWVPKGLGMIRHLTDGSAWALRSEERRVGKECGSRGWTRRSKCRCVAA